MCVYTIEQVWSREWPRYLWSTWPPLPPVLVENLRCHPRQSPNQRSSFDRPFLRTRPRSHGFMSIAGAQPTRDSCRSHILTSRLDIARREQEWREKLSESGEARSGRHRPCGRSGRRRNRGSGAGGPNRGTEADYNGQLYLIYVLREAQRWGLGRRLTASVVADLLARGFSSMIVWVLSDNPARRFYEGLGGIVVGVKDVAVDGATVLNETAYGWPSLRSLQERLHRRADPTRARAAIPT